MTTPTKAVMRSLIDELRALAPNRALSYGESVQVARLQAAHVRKWADATEPAINLIWLVKQRLVPVNFVGSHQLNEESGLTTNAVDGKLQVFINQNEPDVRQRFSLLHELKHVLDFDDADRLHARLGSGQQQRQAQQIEWICNEFAAHVLMPTALVKRAWYQTQDVTLAASLFHVSSEAMATRLERLNLTGEPHPAPRVYFRRAIFAAA